MSLEAHADHLLSKAKQLAAEIEDASNFLDSVAGDIRHDMSPADLLVSLTHLKGSIDDLEKLEAELERIAEDLGATRAELVDLK